MLQALNILENFDLKAMGYNSARYVHTVYQAMSLAFADRDFYYGDPLLRRPRSPSPGCSPKSTPSERAAQMNQRAQRPDNRARRSVPVPGPSDESLQEPS